MNRIFLTMKLNIYKLFLFYIFFKFFYFYFSYLERIFYTKGIKNR